MSTRTRHIQNVHFVGIGGIGVSALAKYFASQGSQVSGSDIENSEITEELRKEGIAVFIGPHKASNIPRKTRLVIHSAAAKQNPEINAARKRNIPVKSYAEALGDLTRDYLTIAVAGSHGKSTATALIALMLLEAGFDPTVIIGTKVKEFAPMHRWRDMWLSQRRSDGSNFWKGNSPILLIEADEWNGSFWNYSPALAVITNIDKEHLDFYKTFRKVQSAFKKFLLRTKQGASIVINADDDGAKTMGEELLKKHPKRFADRLHYYTLASKEIAALRPHLRLPGRHNASNAAAAYTVAKLLNIPDEIIIRVFSRFEGAWRRFETVGMVNGAPLIADYAHHPTEIRSTIAAARERFGQKKIIAVFQPHQYERTKALFQEFQGAFDEADAVCLLDIYEVPGRERLRRDHSIHSFNLARAISERGRSAYYLPYQSQLLEFLRGEANRNSVILMMGAGSIWKITKELVE